VVQLAKAAGVRVIATAHTEQERKLVTDLGADETVDHAADLASQVRSIAPDGVDVVAHLAGDIGVVDLVRAGGRFVSTMVMSPDQVPTQSAVVVPVYANPTPEVLEKCAARQAGGETKVAGPARLPPQPGDRGVRPVRPGHPGQGCRQHRLTLPPPQPVGSRLRQLTGSRPINDSVMAT